MSWIVDVLGMKRIKRFVLAENSEKDPIWKSSDNLTAALSRLSSFEDVGSSEELERMKEKKLEKEEETRSHHHGMT